jgi:hypothetical protein
MPSRRWSHSRVISRMVSVDWSAGQLHGPNRRRPRHPRQLLRRPHPAAYVALCLPVAIAAVGAFRRMACLVNARRDALQAASEGRASGGRSMPAAPATHPRAWSVAVP